MSDASQYITGLLAGPRGDDAGVVANFFAALVLLGHLSGHKADSALMEILRLEARNRSEGHSDRCAEVLLAIMGIAERSSTLLYRPSGLTNDLACAVSFGAVTPHRSGCTNNKRVERPTGGRQVKLERIDLCSG